MRHHLTNLAAALLLAGCAGGPPEWVTAPEVDDGFAATDCVRDSGKLALDRDVALAKARAGIARQYERRVAAMDRAWTGLRGAGAAAPFGPVAKSVAEQMLTGLPPARVEYIEVQDARQLCAMVAVEGERAQQVFERLLTAAGEPVDEPAREALQQAFLGAATP
jgi:hypothetical protein